LFIERKVDSITLFARIGVQSDHRDTFELTTDLHSQSVEAMRTFRGLGIESDGVNAISKAGGQSARHSSFSDSACMLGIPGEEG
jgi:hypothetical protein